MTDRSTIGDVAEEAEVSVSTVSRVMNGYDAPPETRQRVLEAAEKLDYRPNMYARGMRSSRTNCVGILIESGLGKEDPWLEKIVLTMVSAFSEAGYRCMVDFCDAGSGRLPELLDSVDGCALLGNFPVEFFDRVESKSGLPLVTYNEKMPYENGMSLTIDWPEGMRQAVQYLLALGHEDIGLVLSGKRYPSLRSRLEGFKQALSHFGREPLESHLATQDEMENGYDEGRGLTRELLEKAPDLTAIIYGSDRMAFGGLEVLADAGRQVPDDISVVGFDNTTWSRIAVPSLTTVGVDYDKLCRRMVGCLESLLGRRNVMPELEISPVLIRRDSTAKASAQTVDLGTK